MSERIKLFKHQEDAVQKGRQGNLALYHDCGCGKTCSAINIIKSWRRCCDGPALVVCPLSIVEAAWVEDCRKFAPELSVVNLWDSKPANRKKKLAQDHDIYVANYETFKCLFDDIQHKCFDTLIVDESSKMKSPTSQITRALLALAGVKTRGKGGVKYPVRRIIPHRYVLSGTPAPNSMDEYWAQAKFITGPGNIVFNDNFYAFRSRYFYPIPLGRTGRQIWQFRKETQQEFQNRLAEVAHVVRKEDAVDLPEQVHEIRDVMLSKPEQQAYDQLKNDLVLSFGGEDVLATSALVEVMKLRQLTSGFCYGETGVHQTGKSKLNELQELLDEIGDKQVIIWANFRHEIREILNRLPNSGAIWSGTDDREKVILDFQRGRTKYLIANPQSAAHGLTFVNCSYAIYFSPTYSYELQKQSQDRIHRIGQDTKCTYYYLIAKGTVDEVVYKAVNNKAELSTEVLNYLRHGGHQHAGNSKQFSTVA